VTTEAAGRRRWSGVAIRAAITLAIGVAIASSLPVHDIVEAMARTGLGTWLFGLGCFAIGHVVSANKWRLLIRASGTGVAFPHALRAHAAGLFANIWLPSIVGGDVVRAGIVARHHAGLAAATGAGVADRVLDLTSVLVLAAVGMALVPDASRGPATLILQLGAIGVVGGGIGLWVGIRHFPAERLPDRLQPPFRRLQQVFRALSKAGGSAGVAAALSLGVQAGFVGLNAWIAAAIGIDVPFAVWLLAWPLAKIASLVPISLGGLGVREVALASLLAPFGVAPTLAIAQALVWQSILFSTGLLGGIAWLTASRAR